MPDPRSTVVEPACTTKNACPTIPVPQRLAIPPQRR